MVLCPRDPARLGSRFVLTLIACALFSTAQGAPPAKPFVLGSGATAMTLNPDGALLNRIGLRATATNAASAGAGELRYDGHVLKVAEPAAVAHEPDGLAFTYHWPQAPELELVIRHRLAAAGRAWTWTRCIQMRSKAKLASDLTVSLESGLQAMPADTWLPLINGVGATLGTNEGAAYRFAGALPRTNTLLALPMVSVPAPPGRKAPALRESAASAAQSTNSALQGHERLMLAADPCFSVLFTPTALEWTYPAQAGLENGCEQRTLVVSLHEGSPDQSLDSFFQTLLSDVPPGPQWLHDIAMVDYDYMSDGGQGWFRDIDALSAALPKSDRAKVLLCLHGWYDFLGRYCFDRRTGNFDREWTVFSHYEAAKNAHPFGNIGGDRVKMGFANCKPVKMSLAEVHSRLNYARARGFRVGIYFADGLCAGNGLPGFDPGCVLHWGGWQGADSCGRSYVQNPLHPKVSGFFLDYAKALLAEFGPDIDMFNWDETFHIPAGQLGAEGAPGYADRAMMRLTRDICRLTDDYNRQHHREIAFLTSDCLGVHGQDLKGPYALVAHGTYQDSWCQPAAWSCGIFSNYRNVLWSCCWWPMSKWPWIEFGVRHYQAPVSLSNGWGDDTGFAEMTDEQRARAIALFNWRKDKPTRLKYFAELPVYRKENR